MKNTNYTQHMKLIWQFLKFTFFLLREKSDVTGHVTYKIIDQDNNSDFFSWNTYLGKFVHQVKRIGKNENHKFCLL